MPRFLHTADWQIGRQYHTFDPEHAPILAEARLAAVERLAALANEHRVDAVLVCGDVFDAQTVSERTVRRLFNALAGFTGPWLMISGNHDAALADSVWTHALRLGVVPEHVQLLLTPEPRRFEGFAVLPAPLTQRHTHGDLTQWFDTAPTPEGLVRVGMAHGSVQGVLPADIDSANPIAADRAARAGLDYLALGDWHGCKRIDARTWYAGTPEPDRFKANDPGHALLVEIAAPGAEPVVTPLRVGQFDWLALDVELQVPSDVDALIARLDALGARHVVDVRLRGQLDLAGHQRVSEALGRAGACCRHLQADLSALRLAPTAADIAGLQADGYLAEVIEELRDAQSALVAADPELAQAALALLTAELARPAALKAQIASQARGLSDVARSVTALGEPQPAAGVQAER